MKLGIGVLGLSPNVFWKLTIREFLAAANLDASQATNPLTKKEMEILIKSSGEE